MTNPIQPDQPTMSETTDFVHVGDPICTCNDPKYSGCLKHQTYAPWHKVESHPTDTAETMPEWVSEEVHAAKAMELRSKGRVYHDGTAVIVWLADDRERFLARVEDLEIRLRTLRKDYRDMMRKADASR